MAGLAGRVADALDPPGGGVRPVGHHIGQLHAAEDQPHAFVGRPAVGERAVRDERLLERAAPLVAVVARAVAGRPGPVVPPAPGHVSRV